MAPVLFPRVFAACVVCSASISIGFGQLAAQEGDLPRAAAALRSVAAPAAAPAGLDGLTLVKRARVSGEKLWSTLDSGEAVQLTIDARLQARVQRLLSAAAPPRAAVVALEPSTGRVLAYVNHTAAGNLVDTAADPAPPAASVFKLITTAALLEHGVRPETRTCYGGGASRLLASDLVDDRRRDHACATLGEALGGSINAVYAKLADRHLEPGSLARQASALGFGERLPSQLRAAPSLVTMPPERLEFARTAAGFWHTHLSPLHGALIAASIAAGGVMPRATLIEHWPAGRAELQGIGPGARRVMATGTARQLSAMMQRTVREGTSRAAFHDARGRAYLPGIAIAGKTGSLSDSNPYRAYSWWVGFAPADKPRIAVAALVVNGAQWKIKASALARDTLLEALSH